MKMHMHSSRVAGLSSLARWGDTLGRGRALGRLLRLEAIHFSAVLAARMGDCGYSQYRESARARLRALGIDDSRFAHAMHCNKQHPRCSLPMTDIPPLLSHIRKLSHHGQTLSLPSCASSTSIVAVILSLLPIAARRLLFHDTDCRLRTTFYFFYNPATQLTFYHTNLLLIHILRDSTYN